MRYLDLIIRNTRRVGNAHHNHDTVGIAHPTDTLKLFNIETPLRVGAKSL